MAKYLDLDGLTRYNNKVNTKLDTKADIDGNYEDMAVGQLLSNTFEEDKAPYNFRTAGGTLEIGDREYDTLVGGTVAFNQLVQNGNFATNSGWSGNRGTVSIANNKCTFTVTESIGANALYKGKATELNHIYLCTMSVTPSKKTKCAFFVGGNGGGDFTANANTKTTYSAILKATNASTFMLFYCNRDLDLAVGDTVDYENVYVTDLTAMFGSTIADYIYTLESSQAGSGISWLKKYGFFTKQYYDYNAGQLMSVKALSHKMVGFNQWDEQWESGAYDSAGEKKVDDTQIRNKNDILVLPNTTYYFKVSSASARLLFFDENKKFISRTSSAGGNHISTTPVNCRYVGFQSQQTTYNNDICLNLHWDGERDGEYEAYSEHIYPLDSDLELRGIPKLDANNNLYYDGDTYESDGTVTRKYGIVDLGSLNWHYGSWGNGNSFDYTFSDIVSNVASTLGNIVCAKYTNVTPNNLYSNAYDKTMTLNNTVLRIVNNDYTDKDTFKTAMSGVYLVYELATPTTETADTFENPQLVDNWGTEEYTDSREVQIPVGHITKYPPDLKAKLESAPDSPASDGDYILRHNNGENTYVALTKELPAVPTTDGTYVLKATVSSGVATLSWVAEE